MAPRNKKNKISPQLDLAQLPDLDFLNPHKPTPSKNIMNEPTLLQKRKYLHADEQADADSIFKAPSESSVHPTPHSLIDALSLNSHGMTQLEALRQADAWFGGTLKLLHERVRLAEEMKEELGQLVSLLEDLKRRERSMPTVRDQIQRFDEAKVRSAIHCNEQFQGKDQPPGMPLHASATPAGDQICEDPSDCESFTSSSSIEIITEAPKPTTSFQAPSFVSDLLASLPGADTIPSARAATTMLGYDRGDVPFDKLEHAIEVTLRSIRVNRAKWNAGGRGYERSTGTR